MYLVDNWWANWEILLKIPTMGLVGNRWANCFRTHNELIMGLLGKYPLAPSVMRSVWKVLPDLWSDCTLGYKTQCSFGAIIESLTALNNSQPLNQLFYHSYQMSSSSNNQYVSTRGLTITCPTATCPLHNHRGDGPYTTPEEVCGSPIVVSQWLTFALDYQNCGGNCHRVSGMFLKIRSFRPISPYLLNLWTVILFSLSSLC